MFDLFARLLQSDDGVLGTIRLVLLPLVENHADPHGCHNAQNEGQQKAETPPLAPLRFPAVPGCRMRHDGLFDR